MLFYCYQRIILNKYGSVSEKATERRDHLIWVLKDGQELDKHVKGEKKSRWISFMYMFMYINMELEKRMVCLGAYQYPCDTGLCLHGGG